MKQNEIALVVLIVIISLVSSLFIGRAVFKQPQGRSAQIEVVRIIDRQMPLPDESIFNSDSLNPTATVNISESNTEKPFSGGN